jgi:type IV fimbrial biogenesis protein FimT
VSASIDNRLYPRLRANAGFTLIELMVTIAVLAIIVSIAGPSVSTQLANQRVKATAATLESALKEARAESIIRRQNITVIYNGSSSPKQLTLQDMSNNTIAYFNINDQSDIRQVISPSTVANVVFKPNKLLADSAEVVYTLCDQSSSKETPKQVRINSIANISTINAGSCS